MDTTSELEIVERVTFIARSGGTKALSATTWETSTDTPRGLKGPAAPPVDRHRYRRSGDAMPAVNAKLTVADPAETVTATLAVPVFALAAAVTAAASAPHTAAKAR